MRNAILPIFFLFAIPAFGAWFTGYAERSVDGAFLAAVVPMIESDATLSPEDRQATIGYYREFPPSVVCASSDPTLSPMKAEFGDACDDYGQFRAARTASFVASGLGALAVFVALVGAAVSFLSRASQYASFVASFRILRATTAAIVVLQAGLVVWLSFWVTAILTEKYYVKLILFAAALAVFAVYVIVKAIFTKPSKTIHVAGLRVFPDRAPKLFARIAEIAAQLGTTPPEHLIAGIDDNFFVCDGTVSCTDAVVEGRTLFVSLTLLRILDRDEADAVLAHEMAHFSGGDVEHSTKLAPALSQFDVYVHGLMASPLSIPVGKFLLAFDSLFELSFGRTRREREHAADANAARITSPDAIARALVKIGAYASYGTRVESDLFEKDTRHETLAIAERIERGFGDYAKTPKVAFDLVDSRIPHPFDSHPALLERIANVGSAIGPQDFGSILESRAESGYFETIEDAEKLETRQWTDYEKAFAANHEMSLVHRYRPDTAEERALVEKHFPAQSFSSSGNATFVTLDCTTIRFCEWSDTVELATIKAARIEDHMLREHLFLDLESDGMFKSAHKIRTASLDQKQIFLDAFNAYWHRARSAAAYQRENRR